VCLAHWLSVQARKKNLAVTVAYVHHGLRRAADADARFVTDLAETLGLSSCVLRAPVRAAAAKRGLGLEEAGRKERYGALAAKAKRGRFSVVATGHQLDDQAETVLLHLLRGTSLEGLGGIPARRALAPGVELVRPLLPITRAEVKEYLKRNGLKSRVDETNRDPKFTRNWVRREVLPLLEKRAPGVKERLSGMAAKVRKAVGR
jgi:tRNA(Ile)-lysidine synthase